MPKPLLVVVPKDPPEESLGNDELWAFNLLRDLSKLPKVLAASSQLRVVQDAFERDDLQNAIPTFLEHIGEMRGRLQGNYEIDSFRLAEMRKLRQMNQVVFAKALGVGAAALSKCERGEGRLSTIRIIVAADVLSARLSSLILERKPKQR